MKKILRLKHWQVFSILTIFYILIFIFQKINFSIANVTSFELAIASTIILLVLFFLWLMSIGISLNQISDNPYYFRKSLLIIAGTSCILGYSFLNLQRLGFEKDIIPMWLSAVSFPFTFWGIIYTFYKVPKSLKSIELGQKAKFPEFLLDLVLFAFFPIGVWIIQPRLNRIYAATEQIGEEKEYDTTTNKY